MQWISALGRHCHFSFAALCLLAAPPLGSPERLQTSEFLAAMRNPVAPEPPVADSVRAPETCACDYCASGNRVNPTAVSTDKCVPALTVDPTSTCRFTENVMLNADESGMPYVVFCLCHCQPLVSANMNQCVQFSGKEFEAAAGNDNGNCNDPKLMTAAEEIRIGEEAAMAAALEAARLAGADATPEQIKNKEKTLAAASEAKKHYEELLVSYENAKLLFKEAQYHLGHGTKGKPAPKEEK